MNAGSLHCTVQGSTACSYSAVDAQYDGRPCWMLVPSGGDLQCSWTGKFYMMGSWARALSPKGLVSSSPYSHIPPCPKIGAGGNCTSQNSATTDIWMVLAPTSSSFDDTWLTCTINQIAVCQYRSRFGRVNASSCAFLHPAGATLECTTGGSGNAIPSIASAVAVPLSTSLVSAGNTAQWQTLPCPFSGTQYSPNDCPCSNNISSTEDALMHLEVSSPDSSDNSIWCFGSGGEDLCSFSWNGGAGDTSTCTFFLPAKESISCKIQFGAVNVVNALWMPLTKKIFGKSIATPGRHWDRLIGHDPTRGPVNKHSFVDVSEAATLWARYKEQYRKVYTDAKTEHSRFQYFLGSLTQIRRLRVAHPEVTFGINEHSDLSPREWLSRSTSLRDPRFKTQSAPFASAPRSVKALPIPASTPVDWRNHGAVVPVKDQGKCGNCWAFSAVATMESHWAIAGNPLVSLSEEFLTDCNYPQAPGGCDGGFDQTAFQFVIKNGIDTEASYPYVAGQSGKPTNCTRHWPPTASVRLQDWINLPANETSMAEYALITLTAPFWHVTYAQLFVLGTRPNTVRLPLLLMQDIPCGIIMNLALSNRAATARLSTHLLWLDGVSTPANRTGLFEIRGVSHGVKRVTFVLNSGQTSVVLPSRPLHHVCARGARPQSAANLPRGLRHQTRFRRRPVHQQRRRRVKLQENHKSTPVLSRTPCAAPHRIMKLRQHTAALRHRRFAVNWEPTNGVVMETKFAVPRQQANVIRVKIWHQHPRKKRVAPLRKRLRDSLRGFGWEIR